MWCMLSKMDRGQAAELFVSGASGIFLPAAPCNGCFHFVFSMSKTSQGEWGTSFVAEIIFHFKMSLILMHQL